MALNPKTAVASRNAGLDTVFNALNSGLFRIYDGTQPADADTALSGNTKLAELALGATAFAAASAGSKAANAITQDSSADAAGTASWATLIKSGGVRASDTVMDMSAGTSGANLNLNTTTIGAGAIVSCSSLTVSQAA